LAKVFNKFTEWRLFYFRSFFAMKLNNTRMDRIEFLLYLGFFNSIPKFSPKRENERVHCI